jgi:hypothetical protein
MPDGEAAGTDCSDRLAGAGMAVESRASDSNDELVRIAEVGGSEFGDGAMVPLRSGVVCDAAVRDDGSIMSLADSCVSAMCGRLALASRSGPAPWLQRTYISVDDRVRVLGGGSICRHGVGKTTS